MASTRRLVAILAVDVAGYTRLTGADEEGTHERLKSHHRGSSPGDLALRIVQALEQPRRRRPRR